MDRIPPHSEQSEAAVVSAWILQEAFAKSWRPDPALFFISKNSRLVRGLAAMDPAHRDTASIAAELERQGTLEAVGGTLGIVGAAKLVPEYGDPWPHVQRLQELAALRGAIRACEQAVDEAYRDRKLPEFVQGVQTAVAEARGGASVDAFTVRDAFTALAESLANGQPSIKYPSGLPTFDSYAGGFRKEMVTTLGAKTSWGKSSFAVMCVDQCLQRGHRPLIVSFEDSKTLYASRLLARRSRVNAWRLRELKLSDDEMQRATDVLRNVEDAWLYLDGRGKTAERMAFEIRSMCMSEGIEFVVIDYLQRVKISTRKQDRRNEVTHVGNTFTDVIKTCGVSGLMLSQLRRDIIGQPTMHHLKETGDLENGAEIILIGFTDDQDDHFLSIEKAKDGIAQKTVRLMWDAESACFMGEHIEQYEPRFKRTG